MNAWDVDMDTEHLGHDLGSGAGGEHGYFGRRRHKSAERRAELSTYCRSDDS